MPPRLPRPPAQRPRPDHDAEEREEILLLRWLAVALTHMHRQLEKLMLDITALTATLDDVKASSEVASAAVLAALAAASAQLADLKAQIDALTATAADTDTIVDSITAAVTPATPEV